MSNVDRVAEETHRARGIVEATIAEAKSVHGEVESRVASLVAQAKVSTAHIADVLSKRVSELAAQSEVHTLHIGGMMAKRLEQNIEAATVSIAATSETEDAFGC